MSELLSGAAVVNVGDVLTFSFKPWYVDASKVKGGLVSHFAGSLFAVSSVGIDLYGVVYVTGEVQDGSGGDGFSAPNRDLTASEFLAFLDNMLSGVPGAWFCGSVYQLEYGDTAAMNDASSVAGEIRRVATGDPKPDPNGISFTTVAYILLGIAAVGAVGYLLQGAGPVLRTVRGKR